MFSDNLYVNWLELILKDAVDMFELFKNPELKLSNGFCVLFEYFTVMLLNVGYFEFTKFRKHILDIKQHIENRSVINDDIKWNFVYYVM